MSSLSKDDEYYSDDESEDEDRSPSNEIYVLVLGRLQIGLIIVAASMQQFAVSQKNASAALYFGVPLLIVVSLATYLTSLKSSFVNCLMLPVLLLATPLLAVWIGGFLLYDLTDGKLDFMQLADSSTTNR
jgi:hypothetical protein